MNANSNPVVRGICTDCPFWEDLAGTASNGEVNPPEMAGICRRNAPRQIQVLDSEKVPDTFISGIRPGLWPITRATDFCGEHPLRAAAYQLGVEELRVKIKDQERDLRRAARGTPPTGGSAGSKR